MFEEQRTVALRGSLPTAVTLLFMTLSDTGALRLCRRLRMHMISNRQPLATLYYCLVAQSIILSTRAFLLPSSRGVAVQLTTRTCDRIHPRSSSRASCGPHPERTLRSSSLAMTSATGNSSKAPGDHARETNGDGGGSGDASNFNADGLSVSSRAWGKVDGDEVYRVDLDTVDGFGASFITYGATLVSVRSGDKDGNVEEVTLQYDSLEEIVAGNAYYGSTVGRVCNRISGASFSIGDETFTMAKNNGPNCLHGGVRGFDKVLWKHEVFSSAEGTVGVRFTYVSPDGEEGFPGELAVKATYAIKRGSRNGTGELHTKLEATLDSTRRGLPTPINLTNHAYWNLSGSLKESIRGHRLQLWCDRYLPLDDNEVPLPTGKLEPVQGTFFDFSQERSLGEVIDGLGGNPPGVDNCLVMVGTGDDGKSKVSSSTGDLPFMGRLRDPRSGRAMEVFGSQPALQVYTSNYLSTDPADRPHLQHYAVCLETQHFPDAMNKEAWRDSVYLQPGATYVERARHVFTTVDS